MSRRVASGLAVLAVSAALQAIPAAAGALGEFNVLTFTDVSAGWGVVWGQVVAASWNVPMQVNEVDYGGEVPGFTLNPTAEVPAPAAAGVIAVGLFAFAGLRRRRPSATA